MRQSEEGGASAAPHGTWSTSTRQKRLLPPAADSEKVTTTTSSPPESSGGPAATYRCMPAFSPQMTGTGCLEDPVIVTLSVVQAPGFTRSARFGPVMENLSKESRMKQTLGLHLLIL
jgi:hypothetical protein